MALEHALENLEYRDRYRDTLRSCYLSEQPDVFYQKSANIGLNYGLAFRGLSDIRSSEGISCCTFNPITQLVMSSKMPLPDTKAPWVYLVSLQTSELWDLLGILLLRNSGIKRAGS